jgi:hypothetical protein
MFRHARFRAREDLTGVDADLMPHVHTIGRIAHQPADVILRKSRIEHIWSGLPLIASVYAAVAKSSVSAITVVSRCSKAPFCLRLCGQLTSEHKR